MKRTCVTASGIAVLLLKVSAPRGTLSVAAATLDDVAGVAADPAAGTMETDGCTTFSGNFEAALVRIPR